MKSKLIIWLCKNWKKNKGKDYPQTWYYMPRRWTKKMKRAKLRLFLEFLCGILGGHELSKTEWGYGGGDTADRHCRWCDKVIVVPKESIFFQFKDSDPRPLMQIFDNNEIEHTG